ncbi:hypothetical protein [Streptomyces sp. NPDC001020]
MATSGFLLPYPGGPVRKQLESGGHWQLDEDRRQAVGAVAGWAEDL